mmetsp:Transcript_101473/g.175309  ORF Transcript_101473/g.175309 Transcript_101473/m.175309 type:complete len:211 (+) Transcript_101473:182-814(+)
MLLHSPAFAPVLPWGPPSTSRWHSLAHGPETPLFEGPSTWSWCGSCGPCTSGVLAWCTVSSCGRGRMRCRCRVWASPWISSSVACPSTPVGPPPVPTGPRWPSHGPPTGFSPSLLGPNPSGAPPPTSRTSALCTCPTTRRGYCSLQGPLPRTTRPQCWCLCGWSTWLACCCWPCGSTKRTGPSGALCLGRGPTFTSVWRRAPCAPAMRRP